MSNAEERFRSEMTMLSIKQKANHRKSKEEIAQDYLMTEHLGEWIKVRQEVDDELSSKQSMFCVCGKLATGFHESSCRRFRGKVIAETVKRLKHLLPLPQTGNN